MREVCPLKIGLWGPFQMAFPWLINGGGYSPLTNWDDPPSSVNHLGHQQGVAPY